MSEYRVFVTPLTSSGVYGSEIEISDWVINDNISELTRAIDSADYDIGVYAYNDVTLVCDASDGYLLDEKDSRSIFKFSRDKAKVRMVFGPQARSARYATFLEALAQISLGRTFNPDVGDSWAVSAWFQGGGAGTGSFPYIINSFQNPGSAPWLSIAPSTSGILVNYANSDSNLIAISADATINDDGRWYHLAVKYNGNGLASGFTAYLNGVKIVSVTVSVDNLAGLTTVSPNPTMVGGGGADLGGGIGSLDELVTLDTLSDAEALSIFQLGRTGLISSLTAIYARVTAWYEFEGNATDSKGTKNGGATPEVQYLPAGTSATTTFRGLINEAAVSLDPESETVSLVVMSYDSVLLNTLIGAGVVPDGCTFQQAFVAIFNAVSGGLFTASPSNINPVYNGTVDVGSAFDNKTAKDCLDALLLPSNSVLRIDSSLVAYVGSRVNSNHPTLFLYGKGDLQGRENIVRLSSYNNGLQRTFNSIRVTGAQAATTISSTSVSQPALTGVAQDVTSIAFYGYRLKKFTIDFVTQQATLDAIAAALLLEFRYPKAELEVTVPTELVLSQSPATDLLDLVSIDNPLSVRPLPGKRLPIIGITSIGDTTAPLPFTEGALVIDPSVAWKVIEMRENPKDFTTVLKLRVNGQGTNDGNFVYLDTEAGTDLLTESGEKLST